jgi:subfamily B ATP-binding cassette protein MsbA
LLRSQLSLLSKSLAPFRSQQPAAKLIRQTARQQWRLLALNFGSSLVVALSEGATLSVVFFAVEVFSSTPTHHLSSINKYLSSYLPSLAVWIDSLSTSSIFFILLIVAVLLQAVQSIASFLNQVSVGYFSARCRAIITGLIHSRVLSFSFPCASGYKVGDLTDYAGNGPEAIQQQVDLTSSLVMGVVMSTIYLLVLIAISPWLLVAVLLILTLISLLQRRLLPRIQRGAAGVSQIQALISSRITEDFQGLRLLHSSGQLDSADQRIHDTLFVLEEQLRGQARRLAVVTPFATFLPILAIALIATSSVLLLNERNNGILPSLVTFVLALQRLNIRLSGIADNLNRLANNNGRLARLNDILSPSGKQFRRIGGIQFAKLQLGIQFERVSLRYDPTLPEALNEISFTLPKGQMLALVGPSGAGKSSIADLLIGLYAPSSGSILIDGVPLNHYDLPSWQHRLGVVSQDTFLFNDTIANNISFGATGVSRAHIYGACEAAQASTFINNLPHGYDTLVGERGYRLSGGQRQRLSLARAILRNPDLLILDEASSALDSQSERLVHLALERMSRNHSVIIIAHRLSTIVRADQILVIEGGRIVESGKHDSLLNHGVRYSELWRQQTDTTESFHA